MISTPRLLAAAVLLLVLPTSQPLASAGAAEAGARQEPAPGAAGIGDPYFPLDGNGGIDVQRYRINDSYRFGDGHLRGETRIRLRATQDLSSFNLDFLLPVNRVTVDGRPAVYDQATQHHELVITPKTSLKAGETVHVVVGYAGRPGRYGYRGESNWLANDHEVVAMNQPHMAPWWFPSNDHPLDKALVDITITVPRGKQVVANGRLVSRDLRPHETGWRTAGSPTSRWCRTSRSSRRAVSRSRAARRTACPGWWPCPSSWRRRCGGTGWS